MNPVETPALCGWPSASCSCKYGHTRWGQTQSVFLQYLSHSPLQNGHNFRITVGYEIVGFIMSVNSRTENISVTAPVVELPRCEERRSWASVRVPSTHAVFRWARPEGPVQIMWLNPCDRPVGSSQITPISSPTMSYLSERVVLLAG